MALFEAAYQVAVTAPNSGLSINGQNIFTFAQMCTAGFRIYNGTASAIYYSKNSDPVGVGSVPVPAGQSVSEVVTVNRLNIWVTAASVHFNDGSAGSITVEGAAYGSAD